MSTSSTSSTAFSTNVVRLPSVNSKLLVIEPEYSWRDATIARLEELVRMPIGWDGYNGQPFTQ